MAKYLLMGDIHLSDQPPSSCTDSYLDDLFDLLTHAIALAKAQQVRAIIWAGDVFHLKAPTRNSHAVVARLIDLVRASGIKHYVVPGNHDLSHDRLESLPGQPLGVVIASGAVELLHGWMGPTDDLDRHGVIDEVYGVPWLMRFDDDTVTGALAEYRDYHDEVPSLVVTHAPLYPPGRENPHESYPADRWAAAMNGTGSVYYGHIHEPHGIYTVSGVTFCNPGAISRGALHEYNLTRTISCAVWDAETGQFSIHELPHKPAEQVFRLAEVAATRKAQVELDGFLTSIGQAQITITSIESVMAHVDTLDLAPPQKAVIRQLLEEVT